MVSRPTTGVNPSRLAALKKFFAFTRSEHYRISMWLKALDPQGWQRYNQCYQKARAGGKLEILDDGAWGIQSCHTLLVNAIANPHKDPGDVKQGWTITYPLGNFTGGEVVFLDLGLKFGQQAGDILMAPASVLTHMVLPHQGGDRYSHVWFTKADVMDPPEHKYFCNIGLCTVGYKQKAGLQTHWATKNEPYHEAARQRRAAGKAVASDNAMEYRGDDYDEDDLDDAGSDASEYGFGVDTGETEATTSDRPTKRQKVTKETLESLALPEGAPTDTRQRYWCDVPGCAKSQASGSEGYTAKATVAKHKRAKHAEEADVADVGSS